MIRRVLGITTAMALLLALPACGNKTDEKARAAGITPATALGFLSISLDPSIEQKRNMLSIARRFPDAEVKEDFEDNRDELLSSILSEAGLDYEKDVKPWLGSELALAVLPGTGSPAPLVAVLIEQDDEDKAKAAIDKANAEAESEGDTPIAYRIIGDFVVATDGADPAAADATLQAFAEQAEKEQGDLSRSKDFADVVDELHGDRLLLGWIDGRDAMELLAQYLQDVAEDFPIDSILEEAGPAAFDIHAARSAVVMEAVGRATVAEGSEGGAPELTESLPEGSFGAFTVFDLEAALTRGIETLAGLGAGEIMAELTRQTGIDLQRDFLSWMGGESVLVAGPAPGGRGFPQFGLIIEPTDRAAAEAALPKLQQAARALAAELDGIEPSVGLFEDRFVLASSSAYMEQLGRDASPSFGDSDVYRAVLGESSSDETAIQLALDIDAIRETAEAFMEGEDRAEYDRDVKPNLEPLDGFGFVVRREGAFSRVEMRLTFD